MKNQKGITLVALVITIIVLLILAGVSISLVLGQNGVLTQASNAVIRNAAATAEQEVKMAAADATTAYYTAWTNDSTTTKLSAYTGNSNADGSAILSNNCQTAKAVVWYITPASGTTDTNAVIYVDYTSDSNNKHYYFSITVSTGAVTEVAQNAFTTATSGLTGITAKSAS